MKKVFTSTLYFLLITTISLNAQVTDPTFDPDLAAQLQATIDAAAAASDVQGTSVAITLPGQGRFIGVAGESHAGVPITSDMQFCVGSNSKLFTAVVLLKMDELGLLSLDDPIGDWLPDFQYIDPAITIRQLLNHQSGIFDFEQEIYPNEEFLKAMDPFVYGPQIFYSPQDVLAMIGPAHFAPGEKYFYSNTNYLLAAMIVEAASGQTFAEKLHEYILDPFDLDHTFLAAYENPNGTVAYAWHLGDSIGQEPLLAPHSMYIGSGSIFSTADDMETWRHHLFAGDIINADELTELLAFEPTSRYSYGLEKNHYITELDDDVWTHTGWVPGYTSVCGFDTIWGSVTVLNNDEKNFDILIPLLDVIYLRNEPVDAGIETILSPVSNSCMASTTPEVLLKNYGVEPLTSVSINYQLNGGSVNTYNWSGNLMTDETAIVALSPITPLTGLNTLWVYTSNPNGGDDNRIGNAGARSQFINNTGSTGLTSLDEDFEGTEFPPAGWLNGEIETHTWARSGLSLLSGTGCAVKANWFDFTSRTYDLELPMVDLTALDKPELSFDYAYAYAGQGWEDELEILVSTDCGESYHSVFHKSGQGLKTALELDLFFPEDAEWKNQKINLSAYKNDDLLIIFRATSSNGNHLYIDNVKVDEKAPNNQRIKGDNSVELEVYPNPVNDIATVSFELKSSQVVVARVFDLNGRLVTTLSEGRFEAGEHQLEWNSQGETSGMYILKVEVGEQVWMEKLSVLN